MQVHVVKSDVTDLPVDAIVLPSNTAGVMVEGLALSVARRGGPTIEREVVECAPVAVGAAVVTSAGELPSRHVIHTPSIESVRRATRAALLAAATHTLAIIAFPMMLSRPSELTTDETARAIVGELRAHRAPYPEAVYLAATTELEVAAFEQVLRSFQ
jgi:O-acetyl-ADP-ribose deacetylase (regulator of RNase III)